MNKMLLSAALVLAGAGLARADEPSSPPPTPPSSAASPAEGGEQAPPQHRRRSMRGAFVLGELTAKLDLTADQQKAVGAILADGEARMGTLRRDESVPQEDRRAKARAIREQVRGQIRAALTADQQKAFDSLPRGRGPGGRTPTPAPAN